MEFKGTKGNWEKIEIDIYDYKQITVCTKKDVIAHILIKYNEISEEDKANALLISKAPEMLDMLKKCQEYFLLRTDEQSENNADALTQLIKQATEI